MLKRVFALLLICISCSASAQTWQMHAQGGFLWNSTLSDFTTENHHGYANNGTAGVGLSRRKGRIEIGLTLGYRRHAFRVEGDYVFNLDPMTGKGEIEHMKFIEKMPALYVAPFINYHFKQKRKLDWYAGVAPVYLRFFGKIAQEQKMNLIDGGNGLGLDLRGGCAYPVTKTISLYSELSVGAVYIPSYFWGEAHMYTGSLSIGATLKL